MEKRKVKLSVMYYTKPYQKENYYLHRYGIGIYAQEHGLIATQKTLNCTKETVRYWKRKVDNEEWVQNQWGGFRHQKYTDEQFEIIKQGILIFFEVNPRGNYRELKAFLECTLNITISLSYIQKLCCHTLCLSYNFAI
jgi:hypothetical protein